MNASIAQLTGSARTTRTDAVSRRLAERARKVIPGGVNSPVRAFGAVGGCPRFIASGSGPYLVDVDGNSYVDLVCSWGPLVLGHAHPAVLAAIRTAASKGSSFGAGTEGEIELAEAIAARVEPVELVRLVSSGTEATMSAVRLARGFTGRQTIVKFAGCYHGHVDALLASAGSGMVTHGLPASAGVTPATVAETIVLPYNDLEAVRALFAQRGDEVAAVIVEAAAANMGVIPPDPGFNSGLGDLCHRHGALLIVDEVLTGFRVSNAGWYGLEPVPADLFTFGKVVGGGLPGAAFGGRREIMEYLAPSGPVYQAGTLSGNPIAVAAGSATLQHATSEVYAAIDASARQVANVASEALSAAGVPHVVNRAGSLFSIFFTERSSVTQYAHAADQSTARYAAFFHAMLDNGVYLPPSAFEAWFLSAAHDEEALSIVAAALPAAARAAANVKESS